jgi:hypothetical protein
MRHGSYDKLNELGYVPEETHVVNGDIIIGKVSPIQPVGNSNKTFKDSSEVYKSGVPGVIDKVWTEIYNHEGYEMRKMRVRSERIPHIGDKMCCFAHDHDVLTKMNGWVNITKITMNDEVATLINGDTLEYRNPSAIQEYDYEGKMYNVDSNQVSLNVTPNHRMYVGNRNGENYKIKLAEECYGKRWKYIKNVENINIDKNNLPKELKLNNNGEIEKFLIFNKDNKIVHQFEINSWLTIFGIWIAEGCVTNSWGNRQIRIATHKKRVKDALNDACNKLNIKLLKYKDKKDDTQLNSWRINDEYIVSYLDKLCTNAIDKYLCDWSWYLSQDQCKKLIDGMVLGDGHKMNGTTTIKYDTSSVKLRDDFQKLCLHAGYSANWYSKYDAGHTTTIKTRNGKKLEKEETITSTTESYRLTIVKTQNKPLVNKNIKPDGTGRLDKYEDFKGKVYCCTVPGDGIIYVRRNGKPVWCGQSRHGQKGTIGITMSHADMPFTNRGITPDMVMNPNALPSRMTIGQLIEVLVGKVSALKGHETDGTPFRELDIDSMRDELKSLGYDETGEEEMYNGMTGKKINMKIFIGPIYYMRLKHLVSDKIHARARGPRTLLTHQPPEGRSRDGGLRFGEMERDSMLAHGLSRFLKERLMETADAYETHICDSCGLFAQRMLRKDNKSYSTKKDIYWCPACKNKTNISKIRIPYAFKLLLQEMMSMNIAPRVRTIKNQFSQ